MNRTKMQMRLNKFLAHAGVCSRREADRWIADGRISVNGRPVMELGEKVDPARDKISVDGRPVRGEEERAVYILMNKPAGRVVSVKDPFGRPTVLDLLGHLPYRVFPVGRLDLDTEGALLLTNDGETALRLTHPRYGIGKTYEVRVEGGPSETDLDKIRHGIFLEGRRTAPARAQVLRRGHRRTLLRVEIHEGRKREIRKLFEAVGFPVVTLVRVDFAGLTLEGLKSGEWRYRLNHVEAPIIICPSRGGEGYCLEDPRPWRGDPRSGGNRTTGSRGAGELEAYPEHSRREGLTGMAGYFGPSPFSSGAAKALSPLASRWSSRSTRPWTVSSG